MSQERAASVRHGKLGLFLVLASWGLWFGIPLLFDVPPFRGLRLWRSWLWLEWLGNFSAVTGLLLSLKGLRGDSFRALAIVGVCLGGCTVLYRLFVYALLAGMH